MDIDIYIFVKKKPSRTDNVKQWNKWLIKIGKTTEDIWFTVGPYGRVCSNTQDAATLACTSKEESFTGKCTTNCKSTYGRFWKLCFKVNICLNELWTQAYEVQANSQYQMNTLLAVEPGLHNVLVINLAGKISLPKYWTR